MWITEASYMQLVIGLNAIYAHIISKNLNLNLKSFSQHSWFGYEHIHICMYTFQIIMCRSDSSLIHLMIQHALMQEVITTNRVITSYIFNGLLTWLLNFLMKPFQCLVIRPGMCQPKASTCIVS